MTVPAAQAPAFTGGFSPELTCSLNTEGNEIVEKHTVLLSPSDNASVVAGTAVTFSGQSSAEAPLTFSVASSPALLASPDIDSGPGSLQSGATYTFTSTKATATPRTIYWDASFTRTLVDCEGPPVSFTTTVNTLTVQPSPAEEAAAAAANRKHEEEVAAEKKATEEAALAADNVSLDGVTIYLQSDHKAAIRLACTGTTTCSGTLTLAARDTIGRGKKKRSKTVTLGTAPFLIGAGKTAAINLALNKTGRALLGPVHGGSSATLTILRASPGPSQTQTQTLDVHLEQQKASKAKKDKR
jgi:hypothetical protein